MTSETIYLRRSTTIARAWYLFIAAVIVAAITTQVVLLFTGGADANSGETGESASVGVRLVRLFLFFTIDSNVIVLVTSLLLVANPMRRGFWWEALRLNALVSITVTGVVYAVLLAPNIHIDGWALATMIGLHAISPIAFIGAWLVFGPRPRIRWTAVPAAFILPVFWLAITFVRGSLVEWYPYPFLDVGSIGLARAALNAALILMGAAVLAILYRFIDTKVPSVLRDTECSDALDGSVRGKNR